jgi:broad specificity phosphatase PhoE
VRDKFNFAVHEWLEQIEHPGSPNGESGKVFRARIEPCLREIIQKHPGQKTSPFFATAASFA